MALIVKVFLLSFCIFGIYAMPNLMQQTLSREQMLDMFVGQMRAALIDTHMMTPGEAACADYYNNVSKTLFESMTNQTNLCFEKANKTQTFNTQASNATANAIRHHLDLVANSTQACAKISNPVQLSNCTTFNYNANMQNLHIANKLTFQLETEMALNKTQLEVTRDNCVNAAVYDSKTQFDDALNTYNMCLQNIKNLRTLELSNSNLLD